MFHVEKMSIADFVFAVKLANTMNWSMAAEDFEFAAKLEPEGCFTLFHDSERAGIITCVSFGHVGWFGNLVVTEAHRRKGAGQLLVKHAIEYLQSNGAETVGLYAYPNFAKFYTQFGFKPDADFMVFQGKATPVAPVAAVPIRKAEPQDIPPIIDFDSQCLGANRKKLIEHMLNDKDNSCYVATDNNEIAGYCAATIYTETAGIGPLLCSQNHDTTAPLLLQTILSTLKNRDVFACAPATDTSLIDVLCTTGLKAKFLVTRMFLGTPAAKRCTYMPESLERG